MLFPYCFQVRSGIHLPYILTADLHGNTALQYAVINSGVCQILRFFQLFQSQICCDDYGFPAPVTAVDDTEYLLQGKLRTAFYAKVIDDQQAVLIEAFNEPVPVIGVHPGQGVQDAGKIGHQNRHALFQQCVSDTSGKKGFPCSYISPEQKPQRLFFHLLPVGDILMCFPDFRIIAFVIGKVIIPQRFVLQAAGFEP